MRAAPSGLSLSPSVSTDEDKKRKNEKEKERLKTEAKKSPKKEWSLKSLWRVLSPVHVKYEQWDETESESDGKKKKEGYHFIIEFGYIDVDPIVSEKVLKYAEGVGYVRPYELGPKNVCKEETFLPGSQAQCLLMTVIPDVEERGYHIRMRFVDEVVNYRADGSFSYNSSTNPLYSFYVFDTDGFGVLIDDFSNI